MSIDALGDRMKAYENINRAYLTKRMPLVLRLDGCHFHTYTKKFNKPFDRIFSEAMWDTARKLCMNIEGAKFAYTQSDEISILITDYDTLTTEPWFGKNVQKMVSVAASMASLFFYEAHKNALKDFVEECNKENYEVPDFVSAHYDTLENKQAIFDCRAFVLPREEVNNYFYWRELDCRRNSVNSMAHALFSTKELSGKSTEERKEMLWQQKNIQWEFIPSFYKNGAGVKKVETEPLIFQRPDGTKSIYKRKTWCVDLNIPIFSEKTDYINELVI